MSIGAHWDSERFHNGGGVMPHATRRKLLGTAALAALPLRLTAQSPYPNRPIKLMVGVPPGGTTDLVARVVGDQIGKQLGQPIVIENRGGAGGNIAAEVVAKAPADGYTLFLGPVGTMTINPFVYAKMPFDTLRDFAPISQLTSLPIVMVVHPGVPARNLREFIAFAKAKPGQASFASGGNGTQTHLAGEMLKAMTGIDMVHVPYKGTSPAMIDLLGGRVSAMFDQIATALPHIRAGKLVPIGVTTAKRAPIAPEIPTLAESGAPGFDATTWHGLLAPAGTPREIVNRLNTEVVKALSTPELIEKFKANGVDPVSSSPEQFSALLQSELARWRDAVKAAGLKPE
jgi:tripartite-type tricarboxylate transporter receptor subunit TctC